MNTSRAYILNTPRAYIEESDSRASSLAVNCAWANPTIQPVGLDGMLLEWKKRPWHAVLDAVKALFEDYMTPWHDASKVVTFSWTDDYVPKCLRKKICA